MTKQRRRGVQIFIAAIICLAFPVTTWMTFGLGMDRLQVANGLAVVYAFGIYILMSTPWWPIWKDNGFDRAARMQEMLLVWFWLTYITHVTWELGWLVLHEQIINSPDQSWAYIWWAYIDGGDLRYAGSDPNLIMMEILSVLNGILGLTGLWLWFKKPERKRAAVLLFFSTAVVHLYATSLYFGGEIIEGFPNVRTDSIFDVGVKFFLANSPWIVFPCFVVYWAWPQLVNSASCKQ